MEIEIVEVGPRDIHPGLDALVHAAPLVALTEALAGRDGHADFGTARLQRPIESLAVEDQADESRASRVGAKLLHDGFRIGHLGNALRIDETGHFDTCESRGPQPADELDLGGGREHLGLALQPIPGSDLDDLDARWIHGGGFYPQRV